MSWLARSIASSLSSVSGSGNDDEKSPKPSSHLTSNDEEEQQQQPETPSRGVKEDISELTETLTRRFWGVASFLAPPPQEPSAAVEEEEATAADSPRIAGIRSDLAEIGGKVKNSISMISKAKAVTEISKIASSFLPFGSEEEVDEEEAVVGLTEEVVVFVRHIAMQPETWLDFPLFCGGDRFADDFELSKAQYGHAFAIEHLVPDLVDLKNKLCSTDMSEGCFWKIYFVLLHSKLNKQDAELLSTPQIMEAREQLLQGSRTRVQPGSERPGETSRKENDSSLSTAERITSPSSIQSEARISEAPSLEGAASDVIPEIETEKHPIATIEVQVVDKSVVEEELPAKEESKNVPIQKSKIYIEKDEDEVDEWLEEDTGEMAHPAGNITSLGQDEDVSFSDLEEDDDDEGAKGASKRKTSS